MNTKEHKITLTQALLIFIIAVYSANVRYITNNTAGAAHQAAWLSVPCSMVVFIPFLILIIRFGRKFERQPMYDILCRVFGKALGKSVCVLYLLWLFIVLSFYIKYSSENLITTAFVGTDMKLLMTVAAIIIGVTLRFGIAVIARMNKIISVLIVLQLFIIIFFLFLHFRSELVTPISGLDIVPVLKSTVYPLTVFAYVIPLFLFNEQIVYDKKPGRKIVVTAGYLTIKNVLLMLALLGMLGYPLVSELKLPLFTAVETISVFNSSAGLDSLFISMWILAEFISFSLFAYGITRLVKNMFKLNSETPALTAILGLALFLGLFISRDAFELIKFSKIVMPYFNLTMGLIVPSLLILTAKLRKMI